MSDFARFNLPKTCGSVDKGFSFMSKNGFESILEQVKKERQLKKGEMNLIDIKGKRYEKQIETTKEQSEKNPLYSCSVYFCSYKSSDRQINADSNKLCFEECIHQVQDTESITLTNNFDEKELKNQPINEISDETPKKNDSEKKEKLLEDFTKIKDLRQKILLAMTNLEKNVRKPESLTKISKEEEELIRDKQRNLAFAARFKSNYQYHIIRQINEIGKLLENEPKKMKFKLLQKYITVHSDVLQALQIVRKYLDKEKNNIQEPLKWVLEFIASIDDLSSILKRTLAMFEETNDYDFFYDEFSELEKKLEEKINLMNENFIKPEEEIKPLQKSIQQKLTKPKDQLSMYRTRLTWQEKAVLAKKKRSLKKKKNDIPVFSREMEFKQRKGSLLRNKSRHLLEENISTFIESLPPNDSDQDEIHPILILEENHIMEKTNIIVEEFNNEAPNAKLIYIKSLKYEEEKEEIISLPCLRNSTLQMEEIVENDSHNVSLVLVKSETSENNNSDLQCEEPTEACPSPKDINNYIKEFASFKKNSEWYEEEFLSLIDRTTEKMVLKILKETVKEIKLDHILKTLFKMELTENRKE